MSEHFWIEAGYGTVLVCALSGMYVAYRLDRPWSQPLFAALAVVLVAATWALKMYEDLYYTQCP